MDTEPEVVWKVVLIAAIGVEFTALLLKSSRLAVALAEGIANVDRLAAPLASLEGDSDVDVASPSSDEELGKTTPLVSRLSIISSSLESASLCRNTWAVMEPLRALALFSLS